MQNYDMNRYQTGFGQTLSRSQAEIDQGLRSFMLGVYNHMILGLAITGVAALGVSMLSLTGDASAAARSASGAALRIGGGQFLTPFGALLFTSPLKWVFMLAPLAFIFFFSFKMEKMKSQTALMLFIAFSAVMGISMGSIFLVFTKSSIVQVFFITAAAFGGLSLWGYTTKRSLSGMGSFLVMGLIGLIIASIVNIFLASSALAFAVSVVGVLIFAGLTAYDTQRLKEMYMYEVGGNSEAAAKASVVGALSLYLNFINMFQLLLSLFGQRQE
jgi:FtsH-binding integral membrane protein